MQAQTRLTDAVVADLAGMSFRMLSEDVATWTIRELAREVQRLRKLATWHDRPRVRITKEGTHFGLEGHLLRTLRSDKDEFAPEHRIILDGFSEASWWHTNDVRIISQPEEQ